MGVQRGRKTSGGQGSIIVPGILKSEPNHCVRIRQEYPPRAKGHDRARQRVRERVRSLSYTLSRERDRESARKKRSHQGKVLS